MTTLTELTDQFAAREQLQNADEIVPAHALAMTAAGTVKTPAGQHFVLTDLRPREGPN